MSQTNGLKSDVLFLDALAKVWELQGNDYYDYWGNPFNNYMETGLKPLLTEVLARFSTNFILQGNFLRAKYTTDSNLSYVSNYVHSSYMELFEDYSSTYATNLHKGIGAVQEAVRMGKMICPAIEPSQPTVCATKTLEDMRAKASAAMPAFWARLGAAEQDELATMYAYFDFKLAYFLIMAGERSYMRYSSSPVGGNAGGLDHVEDYAAIPGI